MNGPSKNRLHGYEAGWLTLPIEMGVASKREAQEAMSRVAQKALDDEAERRRQRRRQGRRRKPEQE